MVISATWERPDVYWHDLHKELRRKAVEQVFFDFLLKNGLRDRFYKADYKNGAIQIESFKKADLEDNYINVSNKFFANNWDLVESSLLSNFQKFKLKKTIQNQL